MADRPLMYELYKKVADFRDWYRENDPGQKEFIGHLDSFMKTVKAQAIDETLKELDQIGERDG